MDANRLEHWKLKLEVAKNDLGIMPHGSVDLIEYVHDMHNCIVYITEQQAEIERLNKVIKKASSDVAENMVLTVKLARLNRAYAVLKTHVSKDITWKTDANAQSALEEAKQIKEGKDVQDASTGEGGECTCIDCKRTDSRTWVCVDCQRKRDGKDVQG